ncbi:MAG: hypothetical protein AB1403_17985 [Candidatus Riflebacteria bacterium]
MPEILAAVPDSVSPAWLVVDYDVIARNLFQGGKIGVNLSVAVLADLWPEIAEDCLRAGLSLVAADNAEILARCSEDFERLFLKSYRESDLGCVAAGIIPVLHRYSQLLALSNQAQMLDRRCRFYLKADNVADRFFSEEYGFASIVERLPGLPMIDLVGLAIDGPIDERKINSLRRALGSVAENPKIVDVSEPGDLISWEILGLAGEISTASFTLGFWGQPFAEKNGEVLFRIDVGRADGLPETFPVMFADQAGRIVETGLKHCILAFADHGGQLPAKCPIFSTGGSVSNPLSPHSWKLLDLKIFLMNFSRFPVYLKKNGQIVEAGSSCGRVRRPAYASGYQF